MEVDDKAVSVMLATENYTFFFYSAIRCEIECRDGVCSRDEFLGGEGTAEGVDSEGNSGGYA